MSGINLAVLGATGVVGSEILNVLENSTLPINSIKMLSSARSAGKKVIFKGVRYNSVREAHRKSGSNYRTIYRWREFIWN